MVDPEEITVIFTAETGGVGQQEGIIPGGRSFEAEPGIGVLEQRTGQITLEIIVECGLFSVRPDDSEPRIQLGTLTAGINFPDDLFAFFSMDDEPVGLSGPRYAPLQQDGKNGLAFLPRF